MPSIKQLQSRLLNKINTLCKVNSDIKKAGSNKDNIAALRRLNNDKGALDRDVRNLERQIRHLPDDE